MKIRILSLSLLLIILSSCSEKEKKLKLVKVTEYSASKVTDISLAKILNKEDNIKIELEYTLSEDEALNKLEQKETDLVIIPNNAKSSDVNIRTLVPLLPRVFMVMTNKKIDSLNLKNLFEQGTVFFEDRSRLDSIIFKRLYFNFDIDEKKINSRLSEELNPEQTSDDLKVYVGLTHLNNPLIIKLANLNWHFFSLDNIDNYRKGSRIEGFTMMNTSAYPFIVPMSLYRGKPVRSVLTFAINDILICRSDLDESTAYKITQTIIEGKPKLIESNVVYNLLNFDYDSQVLSFPKHKGTIKYLNKDEPPVWFIYVKMVWPLISISVVIFGIIASIRQRLKRRKKQNIEMYYNNLLDLRDKADTAKDINSYIKILKELKVLRSEAMKSLANKKLDPGESFNIFLALYNEIRTDVGDTLKQLRTETQKE